MSKETTNYIIIGAAATAVLYYLYTRSTPAAAAAAVNPLAALSQPPAPFSGDNPGFWNFLNTPVSSIGTDISNAWGDMVYGGYDGSGAGGNW
jgi:hypothetical protein